MYFITNRQFDNDAKSFDKFGKLPNLKGPNELTAIKVSKSGTRTTIEQVDDVLPSAKANALIKKFSLNLPEATADDDKEQSRQAGETVIEYYASLSVACDIFQQARSQSKSVLLYVHGYNNDVYDVYKTACEIEKLYGVIVVVFTWPANGGGAVSGTLSYISDKRDARSSKDALNRTIDLIGHYHALLTNSARCKFKTEVERRYPDNQTKQREVFARRMESYCKVSVSMMCHSMGNYVLKHALLSELAEARNLVFDNIVLVAADANNQDHDLWVEALQVRGSLYIAINENDFALSWSRRKPGEQQKARLGHYLKKLVASNAVYVDVTKERGVGKSHAYFDAKTAANNAGVKRFFKGAFSGENLAGRLDFVAHNNTYRPK